MKKILALLLAMVMVLAMAACGSSGGDETAVEVAPDATAADADAAAPEAEGDDFAEYKAYFAAYAAAGAPDEEEKANMAALIEACQTFEDIEALSQSTVLFESVGVLTYDAWLAAGKPEADTEGMVSEAVKQGASGEPSGEATEEAAEGGEATGEPTGEPVAELFEPTADYSRDLDGYKQYAIDALQSDPSAPPDIIDMTVEAIEAYEEGGDASSTFDMLVMQGRILSYEDFLAS